MSHRIHRIVSLVALVACINMLAFPVYRVYAMSPADVDVQLPIGDIKGLIQDLNDAANQLVGEAGIQLRETVRELSEQIRQRIDQITEAAKAIIKETVDQLRSLLNDLLTQARSLLAEVRGMIQGAIQCVNEALAQRIAQIKDSILDLLDHVASTVKAAVDNIYVRSTQLIDTGSNRIATVLDSTLNLLAKIALVIIGFVLLFWLLRSLWKETFPKIPALRYGIPAVTLLLVVGCGYLVASSTALGSILGSQVPIPRWENACANGNRLYTEFVSLKNGGAPLPALKAVGDSTLDQLNWCLYASMSPQAGTETQKKIDEITAMLYPPPAPPPATPPSTAGPCGGSSTSIHPGWVSKFDLRKVAVLATLQSTHVLRPTAMSLVADTLVYYRNVRTIARVDTRAILNRKVNEFMHRP